LAGNIRSLFQVTASAIVCTFWAVTSQPLILHNSIFSWVVLHFLLPPWFKVVIETAIYPFLMFLPVCVYFTILSYTVMFLYTCSLINSLKSLSNLHTGTRCSKQDSNQVTLEWNSVPLPLELTCSVVVDKRILRGQQKIFKIQIKSYAHYILYVFMRQSIRTGRSS
jgi:hypothetical protein